jgi:hypothetical protein
MPLPPSGGDLEWPPVEWKHVYSRYHEHSAWYSGNPNELASVYYAMGSRPQGFWRTNFDRFWARTPAPQTRLMLHEPIAAALATVSSDLLFAAPPDFFIPDEDDPEDKIQERLNELLDQESVVRTCAELAETVAALGGGFLRVVWNKDFEPDRPMLRPVHADAAVPEFQWGRLSAVTFWHVVQGTDYAGGMGLVSDDKEVWRLLERHEPGHILTGLYKGTRDHLGILMPLDSLGPALAEPDVETLVDDLTAVYVPNVRPNRIFRGTALGRSDYDGIEAEMDALDEAATSLMRDLRLARARLIVASGLLESQGKGKGAKFDLDQEVWEEAPVGVPSFNTDNLITPSQFAIRADDHLKVIKSKIEQIILAAGYSATSFGLDEPRNVPATATEIVNRERQSFLTRGKKISYWTPPLEEILETLLEVDQVHFGGPGSARPRVDFADSIRDDAQQVATVVHTLRSGESASTEVRVRMVHPKWTDEQVAEEVQKILDEGAAPVPPPDMKPNPTNPNGQPADQPMDGMRNGNFADMGSSSS